MSSGGDFGTEGHQVGEILRQGLNVFECIVCADAVFLSYVKDGFVLGVFWMCFAFLKRIECFDRKMGMIDDMIKP